MLRGLLVSVLTAAGLWVVGQALLAWHPWGEPDVAKLAEKVVPWARGALAPEPGERALYGVLTVLTPLLIILNWAFIQRLRGKPGAPARNSTPVLAGAALFAVAGAALWRLGAGAAASPTFSRATEKAPLWVWVTSCAVLLGIAAGRFPRWCRFPGNLRRPSRGVAFTFVLLLAGWASMAGRVLDVHSLSKITWVHFNTVFYPSSQAAAGQRMLVDYVPLYGCYAEMLKPWFALVGLSVWTFTATMAGLQFLALGALLFVWGRTLRSSVLLVLGGLALVWIAPTWFQATGVFFDPYYQYYPVRFIFPAGSVLAVWWYLRAPSPGRGALVAALGGLATWWNLDTGAVTLAAWLALLVAQGVIEHRFPSRWRRTLTTFALSLAAGAFAFGGFYLVLCAEGRQWISLAGIQRYQQIYYGSGFFMLPMPGGLHPWLVVAGIYLVGLTVGLSRIDRGRLGSGPALILYLSILGLGLFSYYQGRSHDICLLLACWPAVMVAFLLADRVLAAVRERLLPAVYGLTALPVLLLGVAGGVGLLNTGSRLWKAETGAVRARSENAPTPLMDDLAFVRRSLGADAGKSPGCLFISPYQAAFHAEFRAPATLGGPSLCDYLVQADVDALVAGVRERRVPHVFLQMFTEFGGAFLLESLRPALLNYQVEGRSPDGSLLHFVPRAVPDDGSAFAREFSAAATRLNQSPPAPRHAAWLAGPKALFDAGGSCVSYPFNWGLFTPAGDFAVEIICTPTVSQPLNACLISNHPGVKGAGFAVQRTGPAGEFQCHFGNGEGFIGSTLFPMAPDREHYLVVSYEALTASIYLDGQLVQRLPLAVAIPPSTTLLTVGDWLLGDRRFQGTIQEVKLHEHALSAEVITRTQQHLAAGEQPDSPPLQSGP